MKALRDWNKHNFRSLLFLVVSLALYVAVLALLLFAPELVPLALVIGFSVQAGIILTYIYLMIFEDMREQ